MVVKFNDSKITAKTEAEMLKAIKRCESALRITR